ncbi:MAG: efflux RND transporter periplasmic adaptor subunit [Chitinophagales bacterium]|nr:efflux RND transporter periplasmic adaptor subunit [Chitinophagales bacterium]
MNNVIRFVILFIVVGAFAVWSFFKLKSNQEEVEARVYKMDLNESVLVQTETMKKEPFESNTSYLGSFAPNREVMIMSEAAGRVIKDNIQEGNSVSQGQLIAQLDTDILQNQLKIAENNYDLAEKTAQRMTNAQEGIMATQLDKAQSDVQTLKYQIALYKKQISMATITAPFGGIITSKFFEIGSLAGPGAQMAVLTDINTLKLEIDVPEEEITLFKTGMRLNISTQIYPNHTFQGTVKVIASKADANKNYKVKIELPNSKEFPLKAGMFGSINIENTYNKTGVSIPRTALVGSNKKPEVYVIQDSIAKKQPIVIGASNKDRLFITDGLKENDVVAIGGIVNLRDGIRVTIAEQ